ncbi:MAG: metal-dependent hydrolase [Gammaproteobacteria bacterium]
MDTLTHGLSGMLLARATASSHPTTPQLPLHIRMWCGFLAAIFPDGDFVMRYFGSLSYLEHHRGVTHSILMLPLWAVLLAVIFSLGWRRRYPWQWFVAVSAGSLLIHILGDVITAYGTMVLAPFSDVRLALPLTFIIDPYFSGIILLSLLLAWRIKTRGQGIAVAGLLTLLAYIGLQGYWQQQASAVAAQQVKQLGLTQAEYSVLPQPLSPRHWKLIIEAGQEYHIAYLNLATAPPTEATAADGLWAKLKALYRPAGQLHWETHYQYGQRVETQQLAREAWDIPMFRVLQRFMRYPVLVEMEHRDEGLCAWFVDQRFVLRGLRAPFRFGACRQSDGVWQAYRYAEDKMIPLLN